jgi:signal transduction histidine kinase
MEQEIFPKENNQKLTVKVIDEGIGISQQDLKNIFTPFNRTKDISSRHKNKNGHGLGLSICKRIAEKLNGTIEVNS